MAREVHLVHNRWNATFVTHPRSNRIRASQPSDHGRRYLVGRNQVTKEHKMTTEAATDRTINYAFLLGGLTATIFGIILLIRQEEALTLMIVLLGLCG